MNQLFDYLQNHGFKKYPPELTTIEKMSGNEYYRYKKRYNKFVDIIVNITIQGNIIKYIGADMYHHEKGFVDRIAQKFDQSEEQSIEHIDHAFKLYGMW